MKLTPANRYFILLFLSCALLAGILFTQQAQAAHPAEGNRQAPTTGATDVSPVIVSTPRPDGTIVHEVQYGQTLYDIALAYGVTIEYIKGLNYLSTSDIYVGQDLVIQPASSITPEGSATATLTSTPAPTRTKKATPRPTKTPAPALPTEILTTPTATVTPAPVSGLSLSGIDPILVGIFGIGLAGVALMAVGVILRKKG